MSRFIARCISLLDTRTKSQIESAQSFEHGAAVVVQSLCNVQEFAQIIGDLVRIDVVGVCPDAEVVRNAKDAGGKAFKEGDFSGSAKEFCKALEYSCEDTAEGRRMAAVLYANRAACKLKMGLHDQAVEGRIRSYSLRLSFYCVYVHACVFMRVRA